VGTSYRDELRLLSFKHSLSDKPLKDDVMKTLDASAMAEFQALDPVYVDGRVGPLINLGDNFASRYFRWMPVHSESGVVLYKKVPALLLVRPMSSLVRCRDCDDTKSMVGPPTSGNAPSSVN
jgi:hypothetical protein